MREREYVIACPTCRRLTTPSYKAHQALQSLPMPGCAFREISAATGIAKRTGYVVVGTTAIILFPVTTGIFMHRRQRGTGDDIENHGNSHLPTQSSANATIWTSNHLQGQPCH